MGVWDTGVAIDHPKFGGSDGVTVLQLGDPSCNTNSLRVMATGGCYFSRGDLLTAAVSVVDPQGALSSTVKYDIHGTHVAGTIAADRNGDGMQGVAFGARLVIANFFPDTLKISQKDASGESVVIKESGPWPSDAVVSDYYRQLDQQNVRVTNFSVGIAVAKTATPTDIRALYESRSSHFDAFADGSIDHRIVTVAAAGNYNGAIANIYAGLPAFRPDAEPYWLSVANVQRDTDGTYSINPGSSICAYTQRWCVSAPGTDIYSTTDLNQEVSPGPGVGGTGTSSDPYYYDLAPHTINAGYEELTGTSMAAPHVAGAMALLYERYPYLSAPQVRDILLTTATPLGPAEIYGWGLINLGKAIDGPGQFLVDTVVDMDRPAGGTKVWQGEAWDDWSNNISGPGRLTKDGVGWLRLSGGNSFGGATVQQGVLELNGANRLGGALNVNGGQLRLNGSLHDMQMHVTDGVGIVSATGQLDNTVMKVDGGAVIFNGAQLGGSTFIGANGLLTGAGALSDTHVEGWIAPGNPGGKLTVNGNYEQTVSATFEAVVAPGGVSNQLSVTGTATLDGNLHAQHASGSYLLGDQFNIIQAQNGVQGRFASFDGGELSPFLQFVVNYNASSVNIGVDRGAGLVTAALTANQRAVAASADSLPIWQGLPRPLTQLIPQQVPAALDSLSGDIYASIPMVLVENSRWVRDAALSRAKRSLSSLDADGRSGVWVQALTGSGFLRGDDNSARTQSSGNGWLVGIDHSFEQDWRAGLMGGVGRTNVNQDATRNAKAKLDNQYLGAYGGKSWGPWDVRGGLSYTRSRIDSDRSVSFPGFRDQLAAHYEAATRQAFIEGAYTIRGGQWSLEPYLQYARVGVDSDAIQEIGGPAALHGNVGDTRSNLTTLGLRYELWTAPAQRDWLHLRVGLGYRYASGDLSQQAYLGWNGGSTFGVSGAPIAKRSVAADVGLLFQLTKRQQLELGYSGQFAGAAQDYGANLRWSLQF